MTVEVQTRSVVHIGNDIATEFSFVFRLLDEEFLEVYLRNNATEVETLLSDSVYSVVFNDDGGTVTYPLSGTPISDEYSLIIKRTVPYTQETEISNQGGFQPVVLENQLDRIVMQIQQLAEDVARAVKMKTGTDGLQVPSPVADLYLGWSGDATRLVNKAIASLGDVVVSDDDTLSSTDPLTVSQTNSVKQHLITNYQPLDADLTAIAALVTAALGRSLLTATTAAAARTILELTIATLAEYSSATASRVLTPSSVWGDLAVLTDGATIAVDMDTGYDFGGASNAALALGGDRTLGAPSNVRNGKKGILWFTASGSTRTLTLNAAWVLATGVETGPYSITTTQTLGVAYVCRGTNVVVTSIVRIG